MTLILLTGCEQENNSDNVNAFPFKATVIDKGMDCGETFLISLKSIEGNSKIEDGTYYADSLDSDLKIPGLKIYLNCREPNEDELYPCTTMGPAYPHVIVTESKKYD